MSETLRVLMTRPFRRDSGRGSRSERFLTLTPLLTFAVLLVVSWNRWFLPFQDVGREVITADRLLHGEVLYRDVVSRYGPLPPYLDALALAVLGRNLLSLVLLRTVLALMGLEGLRRLARRLTGESLASSAIVSLSVAACFFLPWGGSYPFPYSVAALEGTVGTWVAVELALSSEGWRRSLLAGLVCGLAAGTKLEVVLPALLGTSLALLARRPRREAAWSMALATALGLAAWGLPTWALGVGLARRQGFLLIGSVPEAWRHLYADVFWGGRAPGELLSASGLSMYLPSAALLLFACFAVRRLPENGRGIPLLFLIGLACLAFGENQRLAVLVPVSGLLAVWEVVRRVRHGARSDPGPDPIASLSVAAALLPVLARQPFTLRVEVPYSALSGPLALVFALAWLSRRVGKPVLVASFVLGLAFAQGLARAREFHTDARRDVMFSRGKLCLLVSEADLLTELVERLSRQTPPGSWVAGFPDAGLVLFLADRRSPFVDDQFHPGAQDISSELEMVQTLDRRPPAAAFILNRYHHEFGYGRFGEDYAREFIRHLLNRMERPVLLGRPAPYPQPRGLRASQAFFFLPKRDGGPTPAPSSDAPVKIR